MTLNYNIQRLYVFFMVYKHAGVRKAAQKLCISPGAVSMQVKKLEEELGFKLFDSQNGQFALTAKAEKLLPHLERLFLNVQTFEEAIKNIVNEKALPLKVTASSFAGEHFLAVLIDEIMVELPEIEIQASLSHYAEIPKMLEQNQVHMAIALKFAHDSEIQFLPYCDDEAVVVVSKNHPLSQKQSVTLEDLRDIPLILQSHSAPFKDFLDDYFIKHNFIPQVHARKPLNVANMKELLNRQFATIFSRKTVENDLLNDHVHCLSFEDPIIFNIYLSYLKKNENEEPLKTVLELYANKSVEFSHNSLGN